MKIQIKQSVDKALDALTPQQRDVLVLRYGLDGKKPRTLQEIADDFSLTRERIRQIQNIALQRLQEDECVRALSDAFVQLEDALRSCGGVASEKDLCETCNFATSTEKRYVHILLTVGKNFSISSENDESDEYWYVDEQHKRAVDSVLKNVHKSFEEDDANLWLMRRHLEISSLLPVRVMNNTFLTIRSWRIFLAGLP